MRRSYAAGWAPWLVRWRWLVVAAWALAIALAVASLGGLERLTREDDGAFSSSSAKAHQLLRDNQHLGKIAILVGATSDDEGRTADGPGAIRAEVGA